jgi:hypothetical protein
VARDLVPIEVPLTVPAPYTPEIEDTRSTRRNAITALFNLIPPLKKSINVQIYESL